jgi:ribosome-associated toxin RatA of RatAB toxin-antitoxin module
MSGESKFPGISNSIRSTETTSGPTKQELTAFNPKEYSIAYKAIAGTPGFFKSVNAEWSLSKKDDNTTGLKLDFEVQFKGVGFLLSPIVKMKLGKVGDVLLDDFQFYVENGKPHPRKLEANS